MRWDFFSGFLGTLTDEDRKLLKGGHHGQNNEGLRSPNEKTNGIEEKGQEVAPERATAGHQSSPVASPQPRKLGNSHL